MARKRINIVQSSTWEFIKEARQTSGYRLFDFLHGYVYARWPYLYISIGKGEHTLSPLLARLAGFANQLFFPYLNRKVLTSYLFSCTAYVGVSGGWGETSALLSFSLTITLVVLGQVTSQVLKGLL